MKAFGKTTAILVAGLLISLLLIIFFVSPQLSEVNFMNATVKEKKVELDRLEQQILAFKTAQSDLAKATRKDDILDSILIKEDLVDAVIDLENAASKSQTQEELEIKELGEKEKHVPVVSKPKDIEEVPYQLSTTSDYAGIVNFLRYLEHLPHFTEISEISLQAETTGTGQNGVVIHTGKIFGNLKGVFFIKVPKK